MSNAILKNPSFSKTLDIKNICDEYFGALNLDLNYFGHTSVFPDGRFNFLVSKSEWVLHTVEEAIPPGGFSVYNEIQNSIHLPWLETETQAGFEALKQVDDRFGIKNPLIIFRKYEDHFQSFCFDLHSKNAHEKYLNHFDLFENFIFYYKDKARELLSASTKNQLFFSDQYHVFDAKNQETVHKEYASTRGPEKIFQNEKLLPKQYFLTYAGKDYLISAREYQCLELFSHGKKIKDLANILNISPRTIDTHLISLKQKLNARSLTEAVEIYWANRIGRY